MMRRTLITLKEVQWLEDNLPVTYLEDDVDWAEIYRGKKTSATVTPVAVAPPAPVPAWEPAKPPASCSTYSKQG
jgi:hypothetical protein